MISKTSSKTIQNILSIRSRKVSYNNVVVPPRIQQGKRTVTKGCGCWLNPSGIHQELLERKHREVPLLVKKNNDYLQEASYRYYSMCNASVTSHHGTLLNSNPRNVDHRVQLFHTESEYHQTADDTLNHIQDTIEYYLEDNQSDTIQNYEINYASGVLTISLPPHGTWVLNKQTPNKQIWWSSPLSGPRRYEWHDQEGKWVWTKYIDYCNNSVTQGDWKDTISLGEALKAEMIELFQLEDGLEELDNI